MVRKLKYREIKCLIQDYPAGKPQDLKVDCLGLAGKSKTKKKKKKNKTVVGHGQSGYMRCSWGHCTF